MRRTKPPVGWEHVKNCFPVPNELLEFDLPAGAIAVYIYLLNFTCGYRLAYGIHRELAEEPAYSFTKEEEERAGRKVQTDGEIDAETDNT